MTHYPVIDDTNKLIQECDSILTLCNKKSVGGIFIDPANNSIPAIELNENDVKNIASKLENIGDIINKISEFSKSISEPFIAISEKLMSEHARALAFCITNGTKNRLYS